MAAGHRAINLPRGPLNMATDAGAVLPNDTAGQAAQQGGHDIGPAAR